MYIVVFGTDKPRMAGVRLDNFQGFADYLAHHPDHPDVVVHNGGPTLSEDGQTMIGTQLVIEAPSLEAGRAFVADSPFGRAGLWGELHIRPWNWMTGRPD
ncbi:MAG: YciI family protein [Gammaproteobacteria bacterium]|nr:YciI family protein [Gammaproteobacteria bacterium]MDE0273607.1 YciI family protein [Gammaproteobacteria bacterium]